MTIIIDLSGPHGNAFYLMGLVRSLGSQLGIDKAKINDIVSKMMSSNYDNLLKVFIDNFDAVVDIYENGKRYIPKTTTKSQHKRKLFIRSLEPIFEVDNRTKP